MQPGDKERYSRQILFPGIGEEGQERIVHAHVAIVGCGALGTFHAAALARAGIGKLSIIDRDYVELSNLQRQWLFDESDAEASLPKAAAAAKQIGRINSSCQVEAHIADLTASNIDDLLGEAQLLLDGTDNFETRYLLNEYAVREGKPWIYGAAVSSYGLTMPVIPGETSCLACVYPEPPTGAQPTCETAGVLGSITAIVASLQVSMALQMLARGTETVPRNLTTIDVWTGFMRQLPQPGRDPDCPVCVRREFGYLNGEKRKPISLCGRNAVQIHERHRPIQLDELAEQLRRLGDVRVNEFALRFFQPPYEMTIFPDGRAIIKGTTDPGIARSLYARYIGA